MSETTQKSVKFVTNVCQVVLVCEVRQVVKRLAAPASPRRLFCVFSDLAVFLPLLYTQTFVSHMFQTGPRIGTVGTVFIILTWFL
jgi:hypothetical protein